MYYAVFVDGDHVVRRIQLRPSILGSISTLQRADHLTVYNVAALTWDASSVEPLAYTSWVYDGKHVEILPDRVETEFYFKPNT